MDNSRLPASTFDINSIGYKKLGRQSNRLTDKVKEELQQKGSDVLNVSKTGNDVGLRAHM